MQVYNTKTRSHLLAIICIVLCCSFFPVQAHAEKQQRSITISEDQEWGQIIVESDSTEFEVDIVTPDGTSWSHAAETDEDILFYYSFENMRHWAAESMPAGTYQVIIDGPADASYQIRNQNSFEHVMLTWNKPQAQTIVIQQPSFTLETAWSYKGEPIRGNSISFYLQPSTGGERIEIGTAVISQGSSSVNIPDELVDGTYKLFANYDNNTADLIELDPSVTLQVKRGNSGEPIKIVDLAAAASDVYAELQLPNSDLQGVEIAIIDPSAPTVYNWRSYEMSELTKVDAPTDGSVEENDPNYDHRYSLFVPIEQNGTYQLAVRWKSAKGLPGPVTISEQQIEIQAREWPSDMVKWSMEDGVTNAEYGELSVLVTEPVTLSLIADGNKIWEQELVPSSDAWTLQLPLSEGEHTYELYLYDEFGNYFTDGRIWTVDHTAPRLEMIGPLPNHTSVLSNLVSGWTEPGVALLINKESVLMDESGYFQLETKASTVHIVVTDESGNETVYDWSANSSKETGKADMPWLLLIGGIFVLAAAGIYLFFTFRK